MSVRNDSCRRRICYRTLHAYRRLVGGLRSFCSEVYKFIRTVVFCPRKREPRRQGRSVADLLPTPQPLARIRYSISIDNLPGSIGEPDNRVILQRQWVHTLSETTHRFQRTSNLSTILALIQALEMYENAPEAMRCSSLVTTVTSAHEHCSKMAELPVGDKCDTEGLVKINLPRVIEPEFRVSTAAVEYKKDDDDGEVWDVESVELDLEKYEENA